MKREKNYKTAKFVEALEHIDVKYIEEAGKKIKERPAGRTVAGMSRAKSLRQVLALVACVLLLSAVIPAVTYLMGHLPDILGSSTGDDTTEQTSPETPPEETSAPAPETSVNTEAETTAPLYDGTTAPPEPEHNGSYGLEYKMNEDGQSAMLFHRGICTDENVIVASVWNGVPVTRISEAALAEYVKYKTVTIPESVTAIDMRAFKNCTGLESVVLHDGISYIGADAFENCVSLTEITLPKSLEWIQTGLFMNCINLQKVIIGNEVERIVFGAFYDCSALRELHYLGTKAEWNKIQKDLDWNAKSAITVVHCSDGDVDLIEYDGSRGLEYQIDGDHAVLVGIGTCTDKDIAVASTYNGYPVTVIGERALYYENINSIKISDTVEVIENEALGAGKYVSVYISSSVRQLEGAFSTCDRLEEIIVDAKNPKYKSVNNCLINKETQTLVLGCKNSIIPADGRVTVIGTRAFETAMFTEITIPNGIIEIGEEAFAWCMMLESIVIPDSVKIIGDEAFMDCERAKTLKIGKGVESIGKGAFYCCFNITEVELPKDLKTLGGNAFGHCDGLKSIVIPNGVKLLDGGSSLFSSCDSLESVILPEGIEEIGGWFFGGCENLKSITIPSSVKAIGENAFYGCYLLKEIIIPEGVTDIGEGAFEQCKGITKIVIPDSVKTIGKSAFEGCTELVSVVLPSSIDEISTSLFSECSKLKEVNIPEGVTAISSYAFRKCISIEKLILPDSVKTIGEYTFNECSALRDIYLGDGLESIGIWAFEKCTSLKEIAFPDSLKEIGHHAFVSSGLESVTIPKGMTTINEGVFTSCSSLKDVSLPQGLTKLDYRVFTGCTSLETLVIPDTVTTLGGEIFKNCGALTEINYKGTVAQWNALIKEDNWNSGCAATLVHCSNGDVSLIESDGSRGLEYRIIGDHAEVIGIGTCTDTEIVIPSYYSGYPVTQINTWAFKDNTRITSVKISDTVAMIAGNAFSGCTSLNSIYISASVNDVTALSFDGCTNITSITVDPDNPYYEGTNCIIQKSNKWLLLGCRTTVIPADGSVEYIGGCSFNGISGLYSITVPEGVIDIDTSAFNNCPDLRELHLPSTLRSASGGESNIISGCNNIEVITIPKNSKYFYVDGNCLIERKTGTLILGCKTSVIPTDGSVKAIGTHAFQGNLSLRDVVLPEGITSIGEGAFASCRNLKSIVFPKPLTKIGAWAFENCSSLEKINIPENVTLISYGAFRACTKLTEAALPRSLKELSWDSFGQCTALKEISFTGTKKEWNSITKDNSWYYGSSISAIRCSDGDVYPNVSNGSQGLEYVIREKTNGNLYAVLVGIGTCTDKNIVTATTFNNLPVTEIDGFAFENVGGFTSITVSEGVTSIGLHAFANCPDLREIYLPSTLDDIYGGEGIAFFGCDALEVISMAENNPKYYSLGNCLIERDTQTLAFGCKNSKIPSNGSVGKIGDFAFSGISSIKEIVIPEGITEIMQLAFSMCDNLEKVTLPNSLTKIGWGAFSSCSSLESIEVGNNVTYIGSRAFAGCTKLKNVTLPKRLDYLGEEVFASTSIESIAIPEGIKEFYGGMFANCRNLRSVSLPAGLERIGGSDFSQCFALQSIIIPEGVTEIGNYTFSSCTNLKEITLPESLTSIGYNAFASCTSLERISLPAAVTKIGHDAFRGCTALTEFIFGGDAAAWNSVKKDANWRTETGIEIIKCSDREVDAGYTQPDYSELSSVPEVYRNIIENKTAFYYCPTGKEIFLDDIVFLFSTREEKITESEVRYSVLDMNGDGDPELVVTNLFDVLVFNDEGGTVYCYMLRKNNGWVREIAVDGTFEWYEPGYSPSENIIIGKLKFSGTDCTIIEVYRRTNVGSSMEPSYEYYVNKRRVSEAEAKDFRNTIAIDLVCQYLIERYPIVKD